MNHYYDKQFAQRMKDNYKPGTRGTVVCVDDIGTIHVNWDNGSGLGPVPGEDAFRRFSPAEIEDETNTVEEKDVDMSM